MVYQLICYTEKGEPTMFDAQTYTRRREKLREQLGSGLALFLGNEESPMNYLANAYRFRQDSSFLNRSAMAGQRCLNSFQGTSFFPSAVRVVVICFSMSAR